MRSENTPRPIPADLPRIDHPVAGWYKIRMVKNGPLVPVRLWYSAPNDPLTGEPLDRSPRWQATRAGQEASLDDVWPWCASTPISQAEFDHLTAVAAWASEFSPQSPEANPMAPIDPLTAAMPW